MLQLLGIGSEPRGLIVARKRSVKKTCCAWGFDYNVGLKTKHVAFIKTWEEWCLMFVVAVVGHLSV